MEEFVKSDVVVLPFPFSDLSTAKRRPALIVANLEGDDKILCQITSSARVDGYSITLDAGDFRNGGLNLESLIRLNRLFTADKSIIEYKAGSLKEKKMKRVTEEICRIMRG